MNCFLRKTALMLLGVFMFFVTVETVSANTPTHSSMINYDDGLLTFSLHDTSLHETLRKVSRETGVLFLFDTKNDSHISLSIQKMPLEKGIKLLLRSYNHVIFHVLDQEGRSRLSRVRVFGPIRELRKPLGGKKVNMKNSSPTLNSSISHEKNKSIVMKGNNSWLSGSWNANNVNPFAGGARAEILRKLAESRNAMEMLQHKGEAEATILNGKISELEKSMASGDGDPENLMEITELEGQLQRTEQNNARLLINEQKNIIGLQSQLTKTKSPDEQKQEVVARVNRQTGLSGSPAKSERKQNASKPGGSLAEL
jgi:hypothetical protein